MRKITLILFLTYLMASCVSLKKYNLLEADYQRCGEDQRAYEQCEKGGKNE